MPVSANDNLYTTNQLIHHENQVSCDQTNDDEETIIIVPTMLP